VSAVRAQGPSHAIERVPFVRQEPKWCGPAALESVLRFYGLDGTQQEIAREIALPSGEVLNLDLKLYARRKGFRAESRRATLTSARTRAIFHRRSQILTMEGS